MAVSLSMMQGVILDMVAEGKSPRQISEVLGISPAEAAQQAYKLLDSEIVTDIEQRRKLQVYRLEKMIEALWARTLRDGDKDDVKNVREIMSDLNVLLALNKEQDAEQMSRMHAHQLAAYMTALMGLVAAFRAIAPTLMTEDEWATWTADKLEIAQTQMTLEIEN